LLRLPAAATRENVSPRVGGASVIVIGEVHGFCDACEIRLLREFAREVGDRPRVLVHEALYAAWQPWLDRVNAAGYDRARLEDELMDISRGNRLGAGAEGAYRSASRVCVEALASGYRVCALDRSEPPTVR